MPILNERAIFKGGGAVVNQTRLKHIKSREDSITVTVSFTPAAIGFKGNSFFSNPPS